MILLIILLFILIIICGFLFYYYSIEKNKNIEIIKINNKTIEENKKIELINNSLLEKQELINKIYKQKQNELAEIQQHINNAEEISQQSFKRYAETLDELYKNKEEQYDELIKELEQSYDNKQDEILAEMATIQENLDNIANTRAAALEAQLREEQIKQQAEFYSLNIDTIDKREVHILHSIESELRDPRPVRMIIWTTYYSKKANDLCSRVLGSNKKTGIYKITNKENGLCYIGQAKDIKERWREHMKCGLGIDTPANNKLYQAMTKEGIDNFTFELLEECAAANLNKKEAFYINLYNSYSLGYNSNRGVKSN